MKMWIYSIQFFRVTTLKTLNICVFSMSEFKFQFKLNDLKIDICGKLLETVTPQIMNNRTKMGACALVL